MYVFWRRLVARRFHVEPLNWIGLVAGARLVEVFCPILELRSEFGYQFHANFVTAWADRWADGGKNIFRLAAEFGLHAANGFLRDACKRSAPTGVNGRDGALVGIDKKYRDAIGGLRSQKQTGR